MHNDSGSRPKWHVFEPQAAPDTTGMYCIYACQSRWRICNAYILLRLDGLCEFRSSHEWYSCCDCRSGISGSIDKKKINMSTIGQVSFVADATTHSSEYGCFQQRNHQKRKYLSKKSKVSLKYVSV
jgi:hypothetical protein